MKFLNTIEYPWYSDPVFRTRWVACDQLIMAVFLDDTCVSKAEKFWVRFQLLSIFLANKFIFQATIELQGEHTRGQMVLEKRSWALQDNVPNLEVVREFHREKVADIFFSSFSAAKK